jgi:hypothetical protein
MLFGWEGKAVCVKETKQQIHARWGTPVCSVTVSFKFHERCVWLCPPTGSLHFLVTLTSPDKSREFFDRPRKCGNKLFRYYSALSIIKPIPHVALTVPTTVHSVHCNGRSSNTSNTRSVSVLCTKQSNIWQVLSLGLPELRISSGTTERILITCNIGIYSKNFSG